MANPIDTTADVVHRSPPECAPTGARFSGLRRGSGTAGSRTQVDASHYTALFDLRRHGAGDSSSDAAQRELDAASRGVSARGGRPTMRL
jgi:hypothetical protein